MDHSRNQKGLHELKRKQNRKRMRLHKHRCEGKIGPDDRELAHHFAWTKPETKRQEQARLAKGQTDAKVEEAPEVAQDEQVQVLPPEPQPGI